jgi:hypothetical protein
VSTSQEAPALIQYACERCKTRFVLPPSSRQLSIGGKLHAFSMAIGRAFKQHEGLGTGYDTARRQLLAKMDDEAYQSFVQSFRFCHECRQFVCNECWSTSRRSCLTCVAKSMTGTVRPRPPFAPTGPEIPRPVVSTAVPRKGRLRRDMALVALAIAIVLLSVEAGVLVVNATGGVADATPETIYVTPSPTAGPSATPIATATATATATPTDTPTESPSASLSATPTATPTLPPAPTQAPPPVVTPAPTPTPVPQIGPVTISCSDDNGGVAPYTLTCTAAGAFLPGDEMHWFLSAVDKGAIHSWLVTSTEQQSVQLRVTRVGASDATSNLLYWPS